MPTFVVYAGEMGEIDKFTCGPTRAYVLSRKIADIHRGFCLLDEHRDKQVQQPAYNKKMTLQQQQQQQMQWDQELPQEQLLQELRQLQQQQQQERTAQMS